MTTRANSQFPRPDLHRQETRHYGLQHEYTHSLPPLLSQLGVSLLVSTYQAGKVVAVGVAQGELTLSYHNFERAMGMAVKPDGIAVGARAQVWFLRSVPDLAAQVAPTGRHDACFLTRSAHVTGEIQAHELAWAGDELWLVNTAFGCLCTLDGRHSFVPRWRPPFITSLAAEGGSEGDIVVQPGKAASFTLSGFPSPATAGIAGIFTVTAYDAYQNVATGYAGTVTFSSSDTKAVLPADTTFSNGIGNFSATLDTLGTNLSITATDKNNSNLTATQTGIEVIPFVSITGPSAGAMNQSLTYTIGAGPDPAGTVFTISWGDGSSTQTTATTVSHTYSTSAINTISVTASADGLTSKPASQSVNIEPVTVTVEADPAKSGAEMLIIASTANYERVGVSGNGSGVSLYFDGIALGNIPPTNNETFALVEVFGGGLNNLLDSRGLSISSALVGGPGNDTLYGGSSRNLLIGGAGSDTLYAGSAGDILIGGTTSFDTNNAADQKALAYIMAEWASTASYSTRMKQLSGKAGSGGLNGSYFLNSATVFDDNATDYLYGYSQATGAGLDWFFAHHSRTNGDKVNNQVSGEVVTRIGGFEQ